MDYKPRAPVKKSAKPSKLIALVALLIAFSLPVLLIKTLRHKKEEEVIKATLSLPKIEEEDIDEAPEKAEKEWEIITTQPGDTLSSIFKRLGIKSQTLQTILNKNPHAKALTHIKPNQELHVLVNDDDLEKLIFPLSPTQDLVIYKEGKTYRNQVNTRKMESQNNYITATVRGSLYTTAKRAGIPYKLVQQMTEIFNWEIDFAREVRAGDRFTIVYKAYYIENNLVNTGEILAVTYTTRDETHRAIRHLNADGDYDYFNEKGVSLKKAFSRYPVKFSHISSTFSKSRMHPILHYRRPHKGIDLAASLGTPIRATGDGHIEFIGRDNGYGNVIRISHHKTFTSVYGHMLRFQKGLSKGDKVKRGEIIGYVGQSGLASGPHCHYEFHVNHTPRNPATVELPRAAPVAGREVATFKAKAADLLAQMKLYEEANLATGKKAVVTS
ncbi:peptidoglycan DD-metalloendopeptidase family protein [Legionella adelaidensis]|nr:peptidoglycan DD-metalloendopeptidase family protein [Legionella adelaidensis]